MSALHKLHHHDRINLGQKEKGQLGTFTIPNNWWFTQNSFDLFIPKRITEIISISDINNLNDKKFLVPKPSHWEIAQGDYQIREKEKDMLYYRKVKKTIHKIVFSVVIILSVLITILISDIISRF